MANQHETQRYDQAALESVRKMVVNATEIMNHLVLLVGLKLKTNLLNCSRVTRSLSNGDLLQLNFGTFTGLFSSPRQDHHEKFHKKIGFLNR